MHKVHHISKSNDSETSQKTNYCDMPIQHIMSLYNFFSQPELTARLQREQDVEIDNFTNVAVSQLSQHCQTQ